MNIPYLHKQSLHIAVGPSKAVPTPIATALASSLQDSRQTYVVDRLTPTQLLCIFRDDSVANGDRDLIHGMFGDYFDTTEVTVVLKSGFSQSVRRLFPDGGYIWVNVPLTKASNYGDLARYVRDEPRIGHTIVTRNDSIYSRVYLRPGETPDDIMEGFWKILGDEARTGYKGFLPYAKGKEHILPSKRFGES